MEKQEIEDIEQRMLLDIIYQRHGYDFREYSKASYTRRIQAFLQKEGYASISHLFPALLYDEDFFQTFLSNTLVSVTEFFRDPRFFHAFIKEVLPILQTYPYIKIWHAGCASGEEVYSMAILLKEYGLTHKVLLYGTDINEKSLATARAGIYRLQDIEKVQSRYLASGGRGAFSNYYVQKYEHIKIHDSLRENIVFASHNLQCDGVFADMHVVICRNVFIYFKKPLQQLVLDLFDKSLISRGFLCLGDKEIIEAASFDQVCREEKIYRKKHG